MNMIKWLLLYVVFISICIPVKCQNGLVGSTKTRLDSLIEYQKRDTSIMALENHVIIYLQDTSFNKKQGYTALANLTKVLKKKKLLGRKEAISLDSYDAADECYKFMQYYLKNNKYGTSVIGYWAYYPKTKKIFNDITFEELKY
ncbi:MAG: hypothetical protein V4556_12250 [Bacteroidota bacterium]